LGKGKRRFGQKNVDELLSDVEDQLPFGIGNLRANNGGCILGSLQAMLPLFAALKKIANASIELRIVIQIVAAKLIGLKDGRNCASHASTGLGRRLAVTSCAWLCKIVERNASRAWLC
jgi:hypothetical protein